jgi:hypothetical protein
MNVVIDLEHTISNATHRIKNKTEYQFKGTFQEEFANDRPNENVIMFMRQLHEQGHGVIIITAKTDNYGELVEKWLSLHNVSYSYIIMKPIELESMSAVEFKENALKSINAKIDFALNDVGKECAMFAKNNIPCLRIVQ